MIEITDLEDRVVAVCDIATANRLYSSVQYGWKTVKAKMALQEAAARIATGESPDGMVHFIDSPEGEYMGLSTSITPDEHAKGGYTARYYSLGQLAQLEAV